MDLAALQKARSAAAETAAAELARIGFAKSADKKWTRAAAAELPAMTVQIPEAFPEHLPVVSVDRKTLGRKLPHIEDSGKICIARDGAVLIDVSDPAQVLRDAVSRAEAVLRAGLSGQNTADFQAEFLAYWTSQDNREVTWLPDVPVAARALRCAPVEFPEAKIQTLVVGADEAQLQDFARRLGAQSKGGDSVFFVPLARGFIPPDFDETWSVQKMLETIEAHCDGTSYHELLAWLTSKALPAIVVFSIPGPNGPSLAGFVVDRPTETKKAGKPQPKSNWARLASVVAAPCPRLAVERLDGAFIGERGGASALGRKVVVVIGCGALGSLIARQLALSGVGEVRLIDHDRLQPENLHRHALGLKWLDVDKTKALQKELRAALPHVKVETRSARALQVLVKEPDFILKADLVVLATGDETAELTMNRLLRPGPRVLFCWIEAMGVGGHAFLAALTGEHGCLDCLYGPVDGARIGNLASFIRHGQEVGRSLAGCAGLFTPFSPLDAARIATEASRLVVEALTAPTTPATLFSWHGDTRNLLARGLRLSDRAADWQLGESRRRQDIARQDCPTCA